MKKKISLANRFSSIFYLLCRVTLFNLPSNHPKTSLYRLNFPTQSAISNLQTRLEFYTGINYSLERIRKHLIYCIKKYEKDGQVGSVFRHFFTSDMFKEEAAMIYPERRPVQARIEGYQMKNLFRES